MTSQQPHPHDVNQATNLLLGTVVWITFFVDLASSELQNV